MGTVLCLNALGLTPYSTMQLGDGRSAVDRVIQYARDLEGLDEVVLLIDAAPPDSGTPDPREHFPADFKPLQLTEQREHELLSRLEQLDAETIIYAYADCPFLSPEVTERMRESHKRYFAEYSFAEGYPEGVSPEILQRSAIPRLRHLLGEEDRRVARDSLFRILQKDINAFDVETELSPSDYRLLRLTLHCDIKRNYLLCKALADAGAASQDISGLLRVVEERKDLFRTLPAFVSVQLVEGVVQTPIYSPYAQMLPDREGHDQSMTADQFEELVGRLERFMPDSMLHVSLWGEVALHPEIERILERLSRSETLTPLVETSGVGWAAEVAARAGQLPGITWIVALDAIERGLYRQIRGEGFDEAFAFLEQLLRLAPDRTYVQATRMQENEEQLREFYRYWADRTDNIIVQKYDHYCGRLPDRRVSDISPLERLPCWHLKRDLYVLLDGTVPMCREDLDQEHVLGNVFDEELETIWERGAAYHLQHVKQVYPKLCEACDEYYTFNN